MEFKKKTNNKKSLAIILAVAVAAVMFIPMLYSSIYLGAFWDPYGNLNNVPVAFVNLDKSVTKDNKEYAIGNELEKNLRDNDKVAWKFVTLDEAKKGVESTKYYAMVEIPEDFSQKIADAKDGKLNPPEVIYEANTGRNFIFSQISERVADGLKTEVSSNIQEEISKSLVDNLYDVKVSIKDAANGSSDLQDGTQKLLNGSKELTDKLGTAASGSNQLKDGLASASNGASDLQNGIQQLFAGSSTLSGGLNTASNGSEQLKDGFNQFIDGQKQITDGSQSLIDNLKLFKSSLTQTNDKIPDLLNGTKQLSDGTALLKEQAKDLTYDNVNALAQGVKQVGGTISQASSVIDSNLLNDINSSNLSPTDIIKINAIIQAVQGINNENISSSIGDNLSSMADKVKPLPQTLSALNDGAKNVDTGVNQLVSGVGASQVQASQAVDQLIGGVSALQSGSEKLTSGLVYAQGKSGELSNGLAQLNSGANSLTNGLKSANDGSKSLSDGLNTAASSTVTLADGLNKLTDGSKTITNGLNDANDGAIKLKDGLNEGADKMNSNLKFSSSDMSKFVSDPVTLKDTSINDIKFYGEGLAPYFISLSLWLGSMFINLIISIAKNLKVVKGKFLNSFIGKFVAGVLMAAVQALILTSVLIQALHIDVTSTASFYVSNIFIAVVFFSVMYGVSHGIGIIATPIMFIVFLLQLSSSGGTFPIETAPKFYRAVSTYFPMTYSISTLRMIIAGVNSTVLHNNIIIMLAFMFGSLCVGLAIRALLNLTKKNNVDIDENLEAA